MRTKSRTATRNAWLIALLVANNPLSHLFSAAIESDSTEAQVVLSSQGRVFASEAHRSADGSSAQSNTSHHRLGEAASEGASASDLDAEDLHDFEDKEAYAKLMRREEKKKAKNFSQQLQDEEEEDLMSDLEIGAIQDALSGKHGPRRRRSMGSNGCKWYEEEAFPQDENAKCYKRCRHFTSKATRRRPSENGGYKIRIAPNVCKKSCGHKYLEDDYGGYCYKSCAELTKNKPQVMGVRVGETTCQMAEPPYTRETNSAYAAGKEKNYDVDGAYAYSWDRVNGGQNPSYR